MVHDSSKVTQLVRGEAGLTRLNCCLQILGTLYTAPPAPGEMSLENFAFS